MTAPIAIADPSDLAAVTGGTFKEVACVGTSMAAGVGGLYVGQKFVGRRPGLRQLPSVVLGWAGGLLNLGLSPLCK